MEHMQVEEEKSLSLIMRGKSEKTPRLLMRNGYARLQTAVADLDTAGGLQRRRWRLRIRPRVRILFTGISSMVQRIRNGYTRIMLNFATKARDGKLLPGLAHKMKRGAPVIGHKPKARTFNTSNLEQKYLDYIKRSVADGELAYYTTSLRLIGML